jgi:hypothetical protein
VLSDSKLNIVGGAPLIEPVVFHDQIEQLINENPFDLLSIIYIPGCLRHLLTQNTKGFIAVLCPGRNAHGLAAEIVF